MANSILHIRFKQTICDSQNYQGDNNVKEIKKSSQ